MLSRIRHAASAWRFDRLVTAVERGDPPPVVIYQMGKVGSSTIRRTLLGAGLEAIQIHHANPRTRTNVRRHHRERGLPVPAHLGTDDRRLLGALRRRRLRVVTLVREPVARNISAYFQNLPAFGRDPAALGPERVDDLVAQFLESYPHRTPLRWFQEELGETLGIDVYARPFDPSVGYGILDLPVASLLILRTEASDAVKADALARFLGLSSPPAIRRANDAQGKAYRSVYAEFLRRIELPEPYLDEMYGSRYARHFYADDELASLRRRWAGRGASAA